MISIGLGVKSLSCDNYFTAGMSSTIYLLMSQLNRIIN